MNRDAQVNRLDVVGLLLLGPGLALLVYAMTTLGGSPGGDAGSSRPALGVNLGWGCAAAGLVLLGLFAWWARRRPPNGPRAALVDLRLLSRRPFGPAVLVALISRCVGDGSVLLVALYLQQQRGANPLISGLLLLPQGLGAVAGLRAGGRLIDRRGPRLTAAAGSLVLLLGTIPLALVTTLPLAALLVALSARGVGTSLIGLPPVAAAYQGLDRQKAPRATTTLNIAQRLGSPLGTALLITVLATATAHSPTAEAFQVTFLAAAFITVLLLPVSLLLPTRQPQKV